jgi:site-specific recombinase XerC
MGFHRSRQYRQATCAVIREFYAHMRIRNPHAYPRENPAAGIVFKPDKSRRLPKAPSQAAVDDLFARLYEQDGDLRIRDRLMAELAYGSGLRRAELSRLDIEDIDLEANTVQVPGKPSIPSVNIFAAATLPAARCLYHFSGEGSALLAFMKSFVIVSASVRIFFATPAQRTC